VTGLAWHHAGVRGRSQPLLLASGLGALALVAVFWLDYAATRRELVGLLRDQASALQRTVATAAQSNRAAGALLERQLGEWLLDKARALAELDRQGRLSQGAVNGLAAGQPLLRVGVFAADGTRESVGVWPGLGPGPGGPGAHELDHGRGAGHGAGRRGPGAGAVPGGPGVVREILDGDRGEIVSGVHPNRWGSGERISAAVRRSRGGAILVAIDASVVGELQRPASLQSLLEDVTRHSPEIAYTVFEHPSGRLVFGDAPAQRDAASRPVPGEHEVVVAGRPVLEFASAVPLAGGDPATLRLGLRLDGLQRTERRMALRLLASVLAASALVALAFSLGGLRQRYGVLSLRHARAEEALRRRDRLAAMGELASTVAHEIRNPLNAVGMTAQRLKHEFLAPQARGDSGRTELEELLDVMTSETRRMDRIVQQFLDFARPPRLVPEPTDLGRLVTELVERTRALAASRGIELTADVAGAREGRADPAQLRQALDNIVRNAIEATPPGGRVRLAVREERAGHLIEVRDTGRGIDPEHLPRIFDLYFTTRDEGTGVGLALAQQIVSAHGGTIEVDSRPGAGTTMTIRLPHAAGGGAGA
jgi:signal transduction histidine kinase